MSVNRERLHQKFTEEYKRLNQQQKLAVDTIEGPVMVIAGPGTGKTQILASRIGKILLETDSQPHNILCLTYTDAGVVAMRKRLSLFIGPDAYRVNISTFHAFCNDIIQENLSLFEKTALDPISDLERIELFKYLIDTFPKNHPLKRYRGDVYYEIHNLQSLFSTMKREGWSPAFINERIDAWLADLPTRDEFIYKRAYKQFKAGDLKKDKFDEEKDRMEKLRAAVNEFDRFQQLMRTRNRYDFDDMINWVIKAFEENPSLLTRYQEQFLYILVDEFQDTSGTQNQLVKLLISFWDTPNVFVVGDDDQSIYRFQGANVENMLQFANSYKQSLLTVVLTNNYRSAQPILDVSMTLINNNQDRLVKQIAGLSKNLKSSHPRFFALEPADSIPFIKEYETQRHEMIDITQQVQQLLLEGVLPGRISIIYRENKYGEELTQYFKLLGIPVYSKRHLNLLQEPFARKIILLIKYIAAEHDVPYGGDEMLFEILHFDWFNIPPVEVAKLSIEVADRLYGNNKTSLRRLLYDKANMPPADLFSKGLHPGLQQAIKALEKLIAAVPNVTLPVLIEHIIRKTGLLNNIMLNPEKAWMMQVLTALFDFIKEETHRNPLLRLDDLVNIFDLMEKEGLPLPLVQVSGNDKGVNLLTAHGSKGLEFEYVFMAGCNASFWEKKRKPGGSYKFPENIFSATASVSDSVSPSTGGGREGADFEELRRLFYVALTRAEQYLTISYSRYKNDGKELEPSIFIAEIQEQHLLPVENVFISDETLTEFQIIQFAEAEAPEIGRIEDDFITALLDRFVMNVTALNNYLKCPLEFYFKNLLRIPSPKNEATEFGSAIHHALQRLFEKMKERSNVFPGKAEFVDDFYWYMHRHRENFTREQFDRRLEYGLDVLTNYYDNYIHSWNRIVTVERNIRNIVVDGVPLKGKLDKLEFDGKQVNIVDYKTGDPEKARAKLQPPNDRDPNGGDYWRQAVFYKILVDNYESRDWQVMSTEFDFIEPDKKKIYRKEKVIITQPDITTVSHQIVSVWQKIQNREFYIGCGKEDCHWCSFVKNHKLAIALHDLTEEEER
jgi:DNA helicase-2/ATP-dependent DNA helicase PcrA